MIPKKIHYIWLGNKKKDRLSLICINSWHEKLPDYEIIEWNEDNLKLDELCKDNKFLSECMKKNLWAFASDYLRLIVLKNEGGIYLDTDVQVLKNFDDLLDMPMFVGKEVDDYIGTGIIGSEKNNPVIKELIDFYSDNIWNVDYCNNPIIFTNILSSRDDLKKNCEILPQKLFSPYNPNEESLTLVKDSVDSYTIHWFNSNWGMSRKGYVFLQTKHYKGIRKYYEIIRKNMGYLKRKWRGTF